MVSAFARFTQRVQAARRAAWAEARNDFPELRYVQSRGTWLCTVDRNGQSSPNPRAECPNWKGTRAELTALIADVVANHPHVTAIYVSGGYDAAVSPYHYRELDDYAPWAAEWDVLVWRRNEDGTTETVWNQEAQQ